MASNQMELVLHIGKAPVKWTAEGLTLDEKMTWEQTKELITSFKLFADAGTLALSDALSFAKSKGWEEQTEMLLGELAFDEAMVRKAVAVGYVPRGLRHPKLTVEHYYVVSGLEKPAQTKWLKIAVDKAMSPILLKRSIEAGKPLTQEALEEMRGSGSGILNFAGILTSFERWERKVGGEEAILHWPKGTRRQWLEDMQPVAVLMKKVQESL